MVGVHILSSSAYGSCPHLKTRSRDDPYQKSPQRPSLTRLTLEPFTRPRITWIFSRRNSTNYHVTTAILVSLVSLQLCNFGDHALSIASLYHWNYSTRNYAYTTVVENIPNIVSCPLWLRSVQLSSCRMNHGVQKKLPLTMDYSASTIQNSAKVLDCQRNLSLAYTNNFQACMRVTRDVTLVSMLWTRLRLPILRKALLHSPIKTSKTSILKRPCKSFTTIYS